MRHKARDSGGKLALLLLLCHHIGYCPVRDWTRICYAIGSENIRIHPFTCYRFRGGLISFPLWRVDLKISGFAAELAGCVWTVAVSEKKKLRFQNYPDTCRRGLSTPPNNSKIAAKIQMGLLKLVYSEQRSKYKLHTPKNSKSKKK